MSLPPLENGDCLNRFEFERRYNAMPSHKKAELIEGVVYMAFCGSLITMLNRLTDLFTTTAYRG